MANTRKAYLEHVAIFVRDIHFHIRFFAEVLGMTMREVDGTPETPRQYWTLGGMQFIAMPEFAGPEGRLGASRRDVRGPRSGARGRAHVRREGNAAGPQLAAVARRPRRRIHPGRGDAVGRALAIDPRA